MSCRLGHEVASRAFPDVETNFSTWYAPSPSECFPPAQKYTLGTGVATCQLSIEAPSEVGQDDMWPLVHNTGTLIGC